MVTTTIDLEKELFHVAITLGQHERLFKAEQQLADRVTIRGFSEENMVTIESNDPEWPVSRIKAEYDLLNFRDYHDKAAAVREDRRLQLTSR